MMGIALSENRGRKIVEKNDDMGNSKEFDVKERNEQWFQRKMSWLFLRWTNADMYL